MFLGACSSKGTTTKHQTDIDTGRDHGSFLSMSPVSFIDSFRNHAYVIYKVHPSTADIQLFNPDGSGGTHTFETISHLAQQEGKKLAFAMNGGMFKRDLSAQGLLIIDGKMVQPIDTITKGYGNFYLQPNGIFAIDYFGEAFVVKTSDFDSLIACHSIRYATQSGPMMVIDSVINHKFTDGSANLHIRNAVGVTPEGLLVFAISTEEISFYDLSRVMLQHRCHQALYLDGFVSKVYLPELSLEGLEHGRGLGPIIGVFQPNYPL